MEILTINLTAATTPQQFRKAGSYFEILSSTGPIGVRFYSVQAGQTNSIDGGDSGTYLRCNFGAFDLVNQYGVAQQIKVLVCNAGEDGGSRRQPGNVRVIDSSAEKTKLLKQFFGVTGYLDAVNQSVCGLLANGAMPAIRAMTFISPTTGDVVFGYGTSPGTAQAATVAVRNKQIAAASSTSLFGAGVAVASAAPTAGEVPGWVQLGRIPLTANQPFTYRFDAPMILSGTQVIAVLGLVINRQINVIFEFEEL